MRFAVPLQQVEFEIPDLWWVESGALRFVRRADAFDATSDPAWPTAVVRAEGVIAPKRDAGVVGLIEERARSILQAIVSGQPLPPLEVHPLPLSNLLAVRDGFHRYYLSVALGFPALPVSIRPYFDINEI